MEAMKVEEVENKIKRIYEWNLEWIRYPERVEKSRVKLLHHGERRDELKNYRHIATISVICKLCMLMVRERIDT